MALEMAGVERPESNPQPLTIIEVTSFSEGQETFSIIAGTPAGEETQSIRTALNDGHIEIIFRGETMRISKKSESQPRIIETETGTKLRLSVRSMEIPRDSQDFILKALPECLSNLRAKIDPKESSKRKLPSHNAS